MASRRAISSPKSKSGAGACSTGAVETLWMREGEGEEDEEEAKEREQEELRKTSDWGREEKRKGREGEEMVIEEESEAWWRRGEEFAAMGVWERRSGRGERGEVGLSYEGTGRDKAGG